MGKYHLLFWKEAPFIRIIFPFIAGILISYYSGMQGKCWLAAILICLLIFFIHALSNLTAKFRLRYFTGFAINILVTATGGFITQIKSPLVNRDVVPDTAATFIVSLKEPLSEKKSSWKALCN